jgi:uncharacterized protein (TIGR03086 family)
MSEVLLRYQTIAEGFTARVEGVEPDRWESPTPCEGWTARDVAAHVIGTHHRVLASVDHREPAEVDRTGDLLGQWLVASDAVKAALADDERASKTVGGMFGEQPFESLVGRLLCADTLVHTWDLARGTGQDDRLDADAVSKAMEFLTPLDETIRRPGGFAAKIVSSPEADQQSRLLNFCGRPV